jgi:hypothetical protein
MGGVGFIVTYQFPVAGLPAGIAAGLLLGVMAATLPAHQAANKAACRDNSLPYAALLLQFIVPIVYNITTDQDRQKRSNTWLFYLKKQRQ